MSFFSFQTVIILLIFALFIGAIMGIILLDQAFKEEYPDLYSEFKLNVEKSQRQKKENIKEDMEN